MRQLIIILVILLQPLLATAQLQAMRDKAQYDFWLYLPDDYKEGANTKRAKRDAMPIVLFLHGRSLCGNDLNRVLEYGPLDALKRGLDIEAVIVAPQNPGGWWSPERVMSVVEWVEKHYNVDSSRLYVLGMSLGGYGTLDFAATYPNKVAAAMALCGGSTLRDLGTLREVPLWIMHGTADKDVPVDASRRVKRLMRQEGKTPRLRYQELIGVNHSLLTRVFYLEESYEWLFKHSTKGRRKVNRWITITRGDMKHAYEGLTRGSVKYEIIDSHTTTKKRGTKDDNSVTTTPAPEGYYIVKQGDTLWRIATNNDLTVEELCKLNKMKSTDVIHPGDRLKVKR
ncbi:MAG: LysM peptidoglycan-binding domain-containing protein [Alistipes sp.]|nr:LysM peptidoglycan-binding domain-containing protein [Alistipes sp.]